MAGAVRDATVAELSDLRVGKTLAVWFSDDHVWHERLVLWPSGTTPTSYYILTPDDDVYVEELDPGVSDGPTRTRIKGDTFNYWSRFREGTYRFSQGVDDDEFKRSIEIAIKESKDAGTWDDSRVPPTLLDRKGREVSTTAYLGCVVSRRRMTGKGLHQGPQLAAGLGVADYDPDLKSRMKPLVVAPEGYVWISEEASKVVGLGEELLVERGRGVMVSDEVGLVMLRGDWIKGRLKKVVDVPSYAEELKGRYMDTALPALEELETGAAAGVSKADDEEAEAPEDIRILRVDYDSQGDRYKDYKESVRELSEHSFPDWPHEGPMSVLHLAKHMLRSGGDPKSWLNEWSRAKEVGEQDRVIYELRTLVEAFHYACTYDQLNVASLSSFETLARRVQAIVDAYASGPRGSPDWGSARYLTGYKGPEDAVSPQLISWASKKGKEQADLANARAKIKDGRRGVLADEAQAVAGGGLPASKAAPKPKRKPGKGLAPPG